MLLSEKDQRELAEIEDTDDADELLRKLNDFVRDGIQEGRFSREEADAHLGIALCRAKGLLGKEDFHCAQAAAEALEKAREAGLMSGPWHVRMAEALLYSGKRIEARSTAEDGIGVAPEDPRCWAAAARLRMAAREKNDALTAAKEALRLRPDDPGYLLLLKAVESGASFAEMECPGLAALLKEKNPSGRTLRRLRYLSLVSMNAMGFMLNTELFGSWGSGFENEGCFEATLSLEDETVSVVFQMTPEAFSHLKAGWLEALPEAALKTLRASGLGAADIELIEVELDRTARIRLREKENRPERILPMEMPDEAEAGFVRPHVRTAEEEVRLAQFHVWHDQKENGRILEMVDAMPDEAKQGEAGIELARELNDIARSSEPELLMKSLEVLRGAGNIRRFAFYWHYEMGRALYYLDRDLEAFLHFIAATSEKRDDEDASRYLQLCRKTLTCPRFMKPFSIRTEEVWAEMVRRAPELLELWRQGDQGIVEAFRRLRAILSPVSSEWALELTLEKDQFRLTISPMGWLLEVFPILAFVRAMPEEARTFWKITPGVERIQRPAGGLTLKTQNVELPAEDIRLWASKEKGDWKISVYAEVLSTLEETEAWPVMREINALLDHVVGEAARIRWLDRSLTLCRLPPDGEGLRISEFADYFFEAQPEARQFTLTELAATPIEWWMKPSEDPDADLYLDLCQGRSYCRTLVDHYRAGSPAAMESLRSKGASAGFFFFRLKDNAFEAMEQAISDFEMELTVSAPAEAFTLVGRGLGKRYAYVECFVWEIDPLLAAANVFFAEREDVLLAGFHTFLRESGTVEIKSLPGDGTNDAGSTSHLKKFGFGDPLSVTEAAFEEEERPSVPVAIREGEA